MIPFRTAARALAASLCLSFTAPGESPAMGLPVGGGAPTEKQVLTEILLTPLSRSFGFLVNPASDTLGDVGARHALLDLVNREAFLAVWADRPEIASRYDLSRVYKSAFPYGWDTSQPLPAEEWELIRALVPELGYDNVPLNYSAKKPGRNLDRGAMRGLMKALSAQGYAIGADGRLRGADGAPLTLEIVSRNAEMADPAIRLSLQHPLEKLGVHAPVRLLEQNQTTWGMRNSAFDVLVTLNASSLDFIALSTLFRNERDIALLKDAMTDVVARHNAVPAGSPPAEILTLKGVLSADTSPERALLALMRALDHVLVNQGYYLPVAYQCPVAGTPCRFGR